MRYRAPLNVSQSAGVLLQEIKVTFDGMDVLV